MKITLDIPNSHAVFFMQLFESLNLGIKVEEKEDISEWHKAILEERLSKYSNGDKSQFVKWDKSYFLCRLRRHKKYDLLTLACIVFLQ
jgi:Putative addiction module component